MGLATLGAETSAGTMVTNFGFRIYAELHLKDQNIDAQSVTKQYEQQVYICICICIFIYIYLSTSWHKAMYIDVHVDLYMNMHNYHILNMYRPTYYHKNIMEIKLCYV